MQIENCVFVLPATACWADVAAAAARDSFPIPTPLFTWLPAPNILCSTRLILLSRDVGCGKIFIILLIVITTCTIPIPYTFDIISQLDAYLQQKVGDSILNIHRSRSVPGDGDIGEVPTGHPPLLSPAVLAGGGGGT